MTREEAVAHNPPQSISPQSTSRHREAKAPPQGMPAGDGHAGPVHDVGISLGRPKGRPRRSRRPYKASGADLKAQYRLTMLVGFVLSLGLLVVLFSVELRWEGDDAPVAVQQQEVVAMQEITQTKQPEQAPPPPRPPVPVEVPNDYVVDDAPLNLDASLDLDAALNVPDAPPPPPKPENDPVASIEDEIFIVVEERPTLIGGIKALYEKIRYPLAARRAGVEGQVYIQFVVDEEGNVIQPKVLRSPHELLSAEALRVIRLARFTPGRQRDRPVKVQMALPITFRLKNH